MRGTVATKTNDGSQTADYRGRPEAYAEAHIPGAIYLDWTTDLVDPDAKVAFTLAPPLWAHPIPHTVVWTPLADDPIVRRTWAVWPASSHRHDVAQLITTFEQPDAEAGQPGRALTSKRNGHGTGLRNRP